MRLNFLKDKGGSRVSDHPTPAPFINPDLTDEGDPADPSVILDYEVNRRLWKAQSVLGHTGLRSWDYLPRRFVDGKDSGRVISWIGSPTGKKIPVRLAQIGAVVMRLENGQLRREGYLAEKVVAFITDLFEWEEIEAYAIGLNKNGFRLLSCPAPDSHKLYDAGTLRQAVEDCSRNEMLQLERLALAKYLDVPTIVDGRLAQKAGAFSAENSPVAGMVKTHHLNYLHERGYELYQNLKPGERTPAFRLDTGYGPEVISWFLRLTGNQRGEMPDWGVVRVEIPAHYFERTQGGNWSYLNKLSEAIWLYRCQDVTYSRSAVSLAPIQRAEESLGACLLPNDAFEAHFYYLNKI
jgi:hypothetical protein